ICDEAKAYLDDQSALILSDARQYGMGMLLASQQPHQLPEGVRREVNTNTSIRFMGNVEYSIAAQYARDMFCDAEFILSMKKYDRSHAEWAVHVAGMTARAAKVRVPYGTLEALPKQRGGADKTAPPSQPATAVAGVHETSETIPQIPENAIKPELSDIELVIT